MFHLNLLREFSWEVATIDFETGAISAFNECIPFVRLHGCHFHFFQSIFRKLTDLGLKAHYINTEFLGFSEFVRCVFATAFLPTDRIEDAFNQLVTNLEELYEKADL